jgi:glycosyltransferase involved in cell wall biosynthesis
MGTFSGMESKRVAVVGTVGVPAKYGGFETLTEYLVKNLSEDFQFTVFCSGKVYPEKLETYGGAKLEYINLSANGVSSIPYDVISIFKSRKFDVLLLLGVSGAISLPFLKPFIKGKVVTNIDGLEWKRDKWGSSAKKFLKFSEKLAVKYSDEVVSDNKVIQDYVYSEYGAKSKLIPYGADHVTKSSFQDLEEKYPFLKERYAFKVCRIEPENSVHLILEAFEKYRELNIVIIGNWKNSEYGKKLYEKYREISNTILLDPIYDQDILNRIRSNAYLYIHGHSAGGTNPSLVEAMYLGLPIFAFGVSYNRETTQNSAVYFENSDELVSLLKKDLDLREIATSMERIAKESYTWKRVSKEYAELF